jgi:hypothetical protein
MFRRSPGLFAGMGLTCMLAISLFGIIPLLGGLIVALCAPILLMSAYIAIESLSDQSTESVASSGFAQAPGALLSALRDEESLIPVIVASLYCMIVVVLVQVFMWIVVGNAWTGHWATLETAERASLICGTVLALGLYFLLASSLIYALPLSFLQNEPLIPAIKRSFKAATQHASAVAILLGAVLLPFALGSLVSILSVGLGYVVSIAVGTLVLPIVAISLHASYRMLFLARTAVVDTDAAQFVRMQ